MAMFSQALANLNRKSSTFGRLRPTSLQKYALNQCLYTFGTSVCDSVWHGRPECLVGGWVADLCDHPAGEKGAGGGRTATPIDHGVQVKYESARDRGGAEPKSFSSDAAFTTTKMRIRCSHNASMEGRQTSNGTHHLLARRNHNRLINSSTHHLIISSTHRHTRSPASPPSHRPYSLSWSSYSSVTQEPRASTSPICA